MTTKTRAQLVAMAADNMMIVGSGQSLAAEDSDKIDGYFDGLMGELAARGICEISDEAEIPAEWCPALAELLANEASPSFGLPKIQAQSREVIEDRLKVIIQRIPASNRYLKTDLPLGAARYTLTRFTQGR